MAVVTINGWNRLAIGFRWPVGGVSTKALERYIAGSGAVDMAACRLLLADPFSKEYLF